MACNNCKVCHFYDTVIYNSHSANFCTVNACLCHLFAETSVYLLNYLIDTGKSSSEQVNLPAFESFAHYCMVCISDSSCNDIP